MQQNAFLDTLEREYAQKQTQTSLWKANNEASWTQFQKMGLPHPKTEAYRYVRMHPLYAGSKEKQKVSLSREALAEAIFPEAEGSTLVFVDGRWDPSLSKIEASGDPLRITSWEDALRNYGPLLQNIWNQGRKREKDPFAALNGALTEEGVFLYLPSGKKREQPLQILHVVTGKSSCAHPRIHLFLGKNASLELIERFVFPPGSAQLVNSYVEWTLDEGARGTMLGMDTGLPKEGWVFSHVRASLKRESAFTSYQATCGGGGVRHDVHVELLGEGAETSLQGLALAKGEQQVHSHVLVDHQKPHCQSEQLFKNVLDEQARSSFEGKIWVAREAQKTMAYQKNPNLVLSRRAQANSKPNLEIFADDVKASHGATVGNVDPEQWLYLRMKGIPKEEAQRLFIEGFAREVVEKIPFPSVRALLFEQIKAYGKGDQGA